MYLFMKHVPVHVGQTIHNVCPIDNNILVLSVAVAAAGYIQKKRKTRKKKLELNQIKQFGPLAQTASETHGSRERIWAPKFVVHA